MYGFIFFRCYHYFLGIFKLYFLNDMIDKQKLINRFKSYITVDTESDPNSDTTPSSEKQWNLANALVAELKEIGMTEVTIDEPK